MRDWLAGRSIRGRVARVLLLVGLLPLLGMAAYIVVSQRAVLSQTANDNLANHALLEAASVERILGTAAGDVEVLASNPILQSPTASLEEKSGQLRQAQDFFEVFEDITLIDPRGNVIDSTTYSYSGTWSSKKWFQEALAGNPAISEAHLIPSPSRLVVVFTAPVMDGSEVSAVVAGQMNMERVWAVLDEGQIGRTGFLVAVDRNGNFVSHPDKALLLSKLGGHKEAGGSATTQIDVPAGQGTSSLTGQAAEVNVLGWRVVALQDSSEANALANDALETAALAAGVVVALTLGASVVLSNGIARPVTTLAAGMRKMAAGSLHQRVPPARLREIEDLSTSFNTMAANLEESTLQLKEANEELGRRYRELADARRQAATDGLTGLANHRALQETLAREVERSLRHGRPVAVLMMDIDGFKLFNDTYGHQSGDGVLRQMAEVITRTSRDSDFVGRYGGDEFMAILPETDREAAISAVSRLLKALSLERVQTRVGDEIPLAVSVGVAVCPDDSSNKEELLAYADASLYEAKQVSGNSVVAAGGRADEDLAHRRTPFGVLDSLVQAIDRKDRYTRKHSQQDAEFAVELGKNLGLSEAAVGALRIAGLLHDVGKIGVPDEILKKPGSLTEEERAIMRDHVRLSDLIVHGDPELRDVSEAIRSHHERWDGGGYPRHLKGEEIPLLGRILALVDAYSAMILDRPYRKALAHDEAVAELRRRAGTQFDPQLVDPFVRLLESQQQAAA